MTKKLRSTILWLVLILALSGQFALAQAETKKYFPDTGHYLTGEFLDFYQANQDPELIYGLPITEAYLDPQSGLLIQYFEKVRFELHTESPPGERIKLTPIGKKTYTPGSVIEGLSASTPNCFQEKNWSFPVCFSFYTFYNHFGGQQQFGMPVSGLEYTRGRLVQFFEYAQLVWTPENPDQARITIAPLGIKYFYTVETDTSLTEPEINYIYNLNISEVHVRAFTRFAVVPNGNTQEVDIIVVDQNSAPLELGLVEITVRYPDGTEFKSTSLATDDNGLANLAFSISSEKPGIAEVIVKVTYNDLVGVSVTSFRIWY